VEGLRLDDALAGYLVIVMVGHVKVDVAGDFELVLVKVVVVRQSEATMAVVYMTFFFSTCYAIKKQL